MHKLILSPQKQHIYIYKYTTFVCVIHVRCDPSLRSRAQRPTVEKPGKASALSWTQHLHKGATLLTPGIIDTVYRLISYD